MNKAEIKEAMDILSMANTFIARLNAQLNRNDDWDNFIRVMNEKGVTSGVDILYLFS